MPGGLTLTRNDAKGGGTPAAAAVSGSSLATGLPTGRVANRGGGGGGGGGGSGIIAVLGAGEEAYRQ